MPDDSKFEKPDIQQRLCYRIGHLDHELQRDLVDDLCDADDEITRLRSIEAWVNRMPDAGLNDQDPRWGWWHERPQ